MLMRMFSVDEIYFSIVANIEKEILWVINIQLWVDIEIYVECVSKYFNSFLIA